MTSTWMRVDDHELTAPWALRLRRALVSDYGRKYLYEIYLPCSGLPSAFALSKSEKILVGLLCQYLLYSKRCLRLNATMSLQVFLRCENIKSHFGCTYRGRGGFPSSRLRLSILLVAGYMIETVSMGFPVAWRL